MKFDKLYRKIILEETAKEVRQNAEWNPYPLPPNACIGDTDFYKRYLAPLDPNKKLIISRFQKNTFRVEGNYQDVKAFLNKLKVDKDFLEKPSDFEVVAPAFSLADKAYTHIKNLDEGFRPVEAFDQLATMSYNNLTRSIICGRWYDFFELLPNAKYPTRIKKCAPKKLVEYLEEFLKTNNIDKERTYIVVEFFVNCDFLRPANSRLEQNSTTIVM